MEDFAEFLGEKPGLFQAFNMVADGFPDGCECLHFILHSHVVLHGGFGQASLGLDQLSAFLFEFFELGQGRRDRGFILAGLKAELGAGKEVEDGVRHVYMIRRCPYGSGNQEEKTAGKG